METWEKVTKNQIPKDEYRVSLQHGEEKGLEIQLLSESKQVTIFFGNISMFRVIEEGMALNDLFNCEEIGCLRSAGFPDVIYQIKKGEFYEFSKKIAGELCDLLELKHYVIITMNYIIEVITQWEPEITING